MPQREYIIKAGEYQRVTWFPVRKSAKGRRRCKAQPTTETMMRLNEQNRQYRFYDLVHCNFTEGDIFLTLTYRDDCMPDSAEAAQKAIQNFFRRLKARLKKLGLPAAKYLYITERGEKSGRIHHHVFLSCGLSRDEIEAIWNKGYANSRRLEFDENGVEGLVRYALKSGVHHADEESEKVGYRTYSGSKNLAQPKKRQNDYRIRQKDAAYLDAHPEDITYLCELYPDYYITKVTPTPRSTYDPDKSPIPHAHFITIWMVRKDAAIFNRKRRRK